MSCCDNSDKLDDTSIPVFLEGNSMSIYLYLILIIAMPGMG